VILETTRIIADWLSSAPNGINALRTGVPKDTGVTDFAAVTVIDSTRDGKVTRGGVPNLLPAQYPAVLVSPADQAVTQASPTSRPWPPDAELTVLVRVALTNIDTAQAERDASQIIRAIWRSVGLMMVTSAGETARTRASVQLLHVSQMQAATLYEAQDDTMVTGGVLVTCRVRDLYAQG
jgi:hypothetical protein